MKVYEFSKNGHVVKVTNLKLDRYNQMTVNWKISGTDHESNNANDEGYYYNGIFDIKNRGIRCSFKIDGKAAGGIGLPPEIFEEFQSINEQLLESRNTIKNELIEKMIKGKIPIHFSIIGCDFPEYSGTIDVPLELKGLEHTIIEEAIELMRKDAHLTVLDMCVDVDTLKTRLNQRIASKDSFHRKAFNLISSQNEAYYGYPHEIVTAFDMKLKDIIRIEEIVERVKAENEKIKAIFDKAKKTGEKQLIFRWWDDCDEPDEQCDLDLVHLYAMPDGSEKIERQHTW